MLRAQADAVRENFVVGGKLKVIPARRNAKLVVFEWLAGQLDAGRRYAEAEINAAIGAAHPDFATLRRGMYDEYFLDRSDGYYWRTADKQNLVVVDEPSTL